MSVFPDWQKHAVQQRDAQSGCIPTGFEMMLRAANAKGIDFVTFQDDFDLDKGKVATDPKENNFGSVAVAVMERYPHVEFDQRAWPKGQGKEKVAFIEQELREKRPLLISLALKPFGAKGGWHIVPAVDMDETTITVLWGLGNDGKPDLKTINKSELARIHDTYDGGDNVAYLVKC